ncbi:MAG TPA: ribokinase [Rhabdaerophilum sp.]|nr:ribokinase [Rhabdaerophilum sp.]
MGGVVVLGSINRDLVVSVANHPRPGETVAGKNLREFPGGKGANQAVAARRAGVGTALVGAIGKDGFGTAMREFLAGEAIDLAALRIADELPTGIALITLDARGENSIVVVSGANAALTPADAAFPIAAGDCVLAQFEVPDAFIEAGFRKARKARARTLLNPAPMKPLAPSLLALTDILVLNETELELASDRKTLQADDDIIAAARVLAGSERIVIVTLGAHGALGVTQDEIIRLEGERVDVVDTTGAGDCFVGNLAAGLATGMTLGGAMRRAGRAAAISVTRAGAAASMPYAHELG